MENNQNNATASSPDRAKFEEGLIETRYTEQGEPYYMIKDGLNTEEYARLAKKVLESEKDIAHDFRGKVINESGNSEAFFEYKSGWFLEGLAEGEVE
ncbi:hypothetical protein [Pedobacter miscanthi]|uniref:Uncharacterized protein n=1 Tax=Pedobacter miscanthi TaxID=2259170 RepID=A0A366LBP9_9SPHI|nr:hypothetical protein [Pedobacter miscanthi]RBQ11298.1 hypothetical protein DRW42_02205 [Pedobacter miscanthi]